MILKELGFWIKTASLFLIRSRRSTFVLSIMILSSVAVLIFLSSMAVGINDAMVRNSVSLYSGHISGFSLPEGVKPEDLKSEGVKGVSRRLHVPGVILHKGKMEPVTLVGVEPKDELQNTALWKKTVKGEYLKQGNSVFLGEAVAEELGATAGDKVIFSPGFNQKTIELTVSGIYKTGVNYLDRSVAFSPNEAVPVKSSEWQAAVFLDDGIRPDSIIKVYNEKFSKDYGFKSWGELMPDLKQLIDLNYVSMTIVIVLVFGVVSLGIAGAFSIFIFKHLKEYGIMKAMGVTSGEMTALIIIEVAIMNLIACFLGIVIGALATYIASGIGIDLTEFTSHNQYFSVSGIIYPRLTFYSLCLPPLVSFIFGLLASIWPAAIVSHRKAADILRIA
ncbi:MAG: ABC transporter permease [Deltaproteobacteria bacterium]|nr:ABC transporter permease [Deltaproteobacteria bacterium]